MKSLLTHWKESGPFFQRPERFLWLFDFDGTLAPIVSHPRSAVMPGDLRQLLRRLAQRYPGHVGVLSGRSLKPLKRLVGIPGLLYGAAHGFEIQGPGFHWRRRVANQRKQRLHDMLRHWQRELAGIRGLWLEDKTWSFCVHYRQTRPADHGVVRSALDRICGQARRMDFKVLVGLKNVEVYCDTRWDKGQAARWLTERTGAAGVFYAGDDMTDETVFRTLGRSDVAVRIGKSATSRAAYYLPKQSHTKMLLKRILSL